MVNATKKEKKNVQRLRQADARHVIAFRQAHEKIGFQHSKINLEVIVTLMVNATVG